jgi:Leucine-rich repeat (LRR) protein
VLRFGSLQRIDLSNNQLLGSIPATISQILNLRSLNLAGNRLTGDIPLFLGAIETLTELKLGHNNLSSTDLSFLTSLSALTVNFLRIFAENSVIQKHLIRIHQENPQKFLENKSKFLGINIVVVARSVVQPYHFDYSSGHRRHARFRTA